MAQEFDATLKDLLDAFAGDWVRFLAPRVGLPADVGVDPLDVDLSTVQRTADKVFRLGTADEALLHIELQSSHDSTLAARLHVYSTLLTDKYDRPVYTVVFLLRPEANARHLTGLLERRRPDGHAYLRFEYDVVRVWELPCEPLLQGGYGFAPLGLLTDEAKGRLPDLVAGLARRMSEGGASANVRRRVMDSSFLLLGLRYDDDEVERVFSGAQGMWQKVLEDSSTYQALLRRRAEGESKGRAEGLAEGRVETRRETLLTLLRDRFGDLPSELEARINAATDADALFAAIRRVGRIERIDELTL